MPMWFFVDLKSMFSADNSTVLPEYDADYGMRRPDHNQSWFGRLRWSRAICDLFKAILLKAVVAGKMRLMTIKYTFCFF